MLQKLPSRKSPCSSPLFSPLSSRMGLFHRPNTGFLCFPDRTLEEGSRRGRWRKRTADIDCSRAWRSPFFPPSSVSSIAATKSVAAADLSSSSFLTDQTAATAPLLYGSLLPDAVLPFSDGKRKREGGRRHGNQVLKEPWCNITFPPISLSLSPPPWQCNHFVSVPINAAVSCWPTMAKKLTGGRTASEGQAGTREAEGLLEPGGQQFTLQLACRFCYLDNSSRSS